MPIYRINDNKIRKLDRTTFEQQGLRERQDLQNILKIQIDVIAPDTLVVAEEFGDWEGSRRRIDLLGIDKSANLVVIELKRTEGGGHMELQALRYASMISTLTFSKLVDIYTRYLAENDILMDATESLLEFLDWNEPNDDQFAQEVKIILASAEFSKELTTSVMWLNDFGLDIHCVRMHPYSSNGETLIDVQTVIPIPEVADCPVRIREKRQKEREARNSSRDLTKFDVSIAGQIHQAQNKRLIMLQIISGVLQNGGTPEKIIEAISWRKNWLFEVFDGTLNSEQFKEKIIKKYSPDKVRRFFINDDELFHIDGKTYAFSNQWGDRTIEAAESVSEKFPDLNIEIKPTEQ